MNWSRSLKALAIVAVALGSTAAPGAQQQGRGTTGQNATGAASLDYPFFRDRVQPIFLAKRPGHARCVTCHTGGSVGQARLQPLSAGETFWNEEQSRKNFETFSRYVVPGSIRASRILMHPLARSAGGDPFHAGGKHFQSQNDAEWQVLAAWVRGETLTTPAPRGSEAVRIVQTNSAGDNVHVIDPATNKVVGVIDDIEVPHGVTSAPDGTRLYITNESLSTVDVVDAQTLKIVKRVPLSGHPNNITISKDGRKVYAGIAQAPGAVDVIDTQSLANVKSIKVQGAVHNVYVTPDGKFAVSGSVGSKVISVIDTTTDEVVWSTTLSAGIRPMAFLTNPDGSTRWVFVQLSDYHGVVVVDFATHQEIKRWLLPDVPGETKHTDGIQGSPAHGLAVTPDGRTLLATSKWYGELYGYSIPEFKLLGMVHVGQHPEWLTLTPDGKTAYVAAAGDNEVSVVDVATLKETTRIPVGQVPKRNGTAILRVKTTTN
jgi:YVTN family beta-propeller protein